jgi:hypothetical protein
MSDSKLDYNKKMIGQKVKVIENNITWIGEIKETVNDDSFLIRDSLNRDNIVSMYDIRSVDMAQLSQV